MAVHNVENNGNMKSNCYQVHIYNEIDINKLN